MPIFNAPIAAITPDFNHVIANVSKAAIGPKKADTPYVPPKVNVPSEAFLAALKAMFGSIGAPAEVGTIAEGYEASKIRAAFLVGEGAQARFNVIHEINVVTKKGATLNQRDIDVLSAVFFAHMKPVAKTETQIALEAVEKATQYISDNEALEVFTFIIDQNPHGQ